MSISTVSEVSGNNPRVESLIAKHQRLSERIDEARKRISSSDFYISDLKKQKLLVKEQIAQESRAR